MVRDMCSGFAGAGLVAGYQYRAQQHRPQAFGLCASAKKPTSRAFRNYRGKAEKLEKPGAWF
jgi:hypothetical protein